MSNPSLSQRNPVAIGHPRTVVATAIALAFLGASVFVGADVARAQENFGTLVNELVDRDRLATHPDGRYAQLQASSYDRGATPLGAPHSFANADTSNFLGTTFIHGAREYVMLNETGPGVLSRWWMTGSPATTGDIRVYVDGSPTPVLSGRFDQLLSGHTAEFGNALTFRSRPGVASGHNLYAPIPYSQSIMVVYAGTVNDQPGWNPPVYYNINYRKYAAGQSVASYTAATPATYSAAVTAANQKLANPTVNGNVSGSYAATGQTLTAGQSLAHELTGGGAIRRLKLNVSGADQAAALQNVFVELTFDGQRTAQIPAGQFFGNGSAGDSQAIHPSTDFYRRVEADGDMTAYWVMPYQNAAQVKLVNRGAAPVSIDLEIDSGAWAWTDDSLHFHADYREEALIPTRGLNGTTDWTMLNVRGRGVYVGDTLSIRNRTGAWWGEGDEKVYVDYLDASGVGNDAQPVHIGTGTEDYYGYAWGHTETFGRPFIAQPTGAGNASPGVTVNSRLRGLDAIPFDDDFKFDMEIWNWADTRLDYGGATYWYGAPGAKSLRIAADLGADYRAGLSLSEGGVPDRAGDGQWQYLASSLANLSHPAAVRELLNFGEVGGAGNDGYGGGQNGHNLSAISNEFLFEDGDDNLGLQGGPGYHELALHPSGFVAGGSFAGNGMRSYVAARWTAGESSAGLANVTGSIRNFIDTGDGVDFRIFVDGVEKFTAGNTGDALPETYFDFDVTIAAGSVIDFVLGNGPASSLFGDESLLRAMIYADVDEFLPLEGDLTGDGAIDAADWAALRTNFRGDLNALSRQNAYASGDLNGDLRNDVADFGLFKELYESAHGAGSFARMAAAAEPAATSLAATCCAAFVICHVRPSRVARPRSAAGRGAPRLTLPASTTPCEDLGVPPPRPESRPAT